MSLNFFQYCPRTSIDFEGDRFSVQDDYDQGDVYTFAFGLETDTCCIGGSNGVIKLFQHTLDDKLDASIQLLRSYSTTELLEVPMPCTNIVFRPTGYSDYFAHEQASTRDSFFLASYADGVLRQFSVKTGACVYMSDLESQNHIFSVAYNFDGSYFASAGKDALVRVVDEGTKIVMNTLHGHSNRVFSVAYTDPSTLVSAGWDATVRLWDTRANACIQQVYGYSVTSSHSVAVHPDQPLLAISPSRAGQASVVLDTRMLTEPVLEIPTQSKATPYSVCFDATGKEVYIGCSGTNQVTVTPLDRSTPTNAFQTEENTVYGVQMSQDARWLGVSGKGRHLQLLCTSAK